MSRAEGSKGGTGSKRDSEAQEAMPVAAPEDSQHAYIVREAVPRVSEDQKLYDSGEPADSAGALEVESLSQLAMSHSTASGAAEVAPCMVIKGVRGYASFLNGAYRRVEDYLHEKRYVYKQDTSVPMGNSPAAGKQLLLYFKPKQQAWAIGLRVGSAGVLAYRRTQGMEPHIGEADWCVSDPNGRFHSDPAVTVSPAGGFTVPAKSLLSTSEAGIMEGLLPPGTARSKAEATLLSHLASTGHAGAFVIRQSTSTPNAFILSVINEDQEVVHVRLDSASGKYFLPGSHHSASSLPDLINLIRDSGSGIRLASGQMLPALTDHVVMS